jgi:hypothetical protein
VPEKYIVAGARISESIANDATGERKPLTGDNPEEQERQDTGSSTTTGISRWGAFFW